MIQVKDCKAIRCPHLQRKMNGYINNGPFYCSADKYKDQIKILKACPKDKI